MIQIYPLIKHQFKNMKILMLLLPASLVLYVLSFISVRKNVYFNTLLDNGHSYYGNIYYSAIDFNYIMLLTIIWAIVVCAAQSWYEKKPSVSNFISCLPYKRGTVLCVKILTTMCFYTVCIIGLGIALLAVREIYFDLYISRLYNTIACGEVFASHDTSFMIVKALFAVWLCVTVFYLTATLFQMLVSNVFAAMVIGFAAPLFPFYLCHYLNNLFGSLSFFATKLNILNNIFVTSKHFKISYAYATEFSVVSRPLNGMYPVEHWNYTSNVLLPVENICIAVLALCAAVLFFVCLFVYTKLIYYANYSDLIAFRKASAAFVILGALCCAMLISNFFSGAVAVSFSFIVTFVISYFAFNKIAGRGGDRHDKKTISK